MTQTIFRYNVPIDNIDTVLEVSGDIVHVGCRERDSIEFWTVTRDPDQTKSRTFGVFGTGHEVPGEFMYRGSAYWVNPSLVWHLFEKLTDAQMLSEFLSKGLF